MADNGYNKEAKEAVLTLFLKYGIVEPQMTGQVLVNLNCGGITQIETHPVKILR